MEHIKRVMHGESKTRLYRIWSNLKNRVLPNSVKAKYYFDRGIGLCDEWKNSFISFRDWSINNGYDDKLTIDRIDNNLGYSPENCRWVDMKVQANNRSNNITVYADKACVPFSDVCRILGVDYKTAYDKIIMNLVANKNSSNTGKSSWSEEDKSRMDNLCHFLEEYGDQYYGHLTLQGTISWLKSLRPQPKQEWNEEDEEIIDYLIDYLESELDSSYTDLDKETFTKEINWLKSLKPQKQEWSKEDERMIKIVKEIAYTIAQTSDKQFLERHGTNEQELKNWSLSCSPQSQWRPSDEQMGALWDSIKHNLHLHPVLKSLYNDLKKLKG